MEAEERKERFIALLNKLLDDCGGIKVKLAQKLEINSSTLTRWFQGKIDPATLDLVNFVRLSEIANLPTDELAKMIGMTANSEEKVLDKFKSLIEDLLSIQSMEQLGNKLGVTYGAIAGWLSSQKNINPERIPIGTIIALATEKGWTIERLLIYLGLKAPQTENNLLFKLQSGATVLSFNEQVKLLAWLSDRVQEQVTQEPTRQQAQERKSQLTICILLEKENLAIASDYFTNFAKHLQLQPENIKIATPSSIPDSLEGFDILILDINSPQSPCLPLLESLEFEGDILIFADPSLPDDLRERLSASSCCSIVEAYK